MRRVLLIFLISLATLAHAIQPPYVFRHYSTTDGLPSNCVRDLMQDSSHFIWIATDGGLVRFDGQSFKVFLPSLVKDAECNDDFISSIHECGGRLWVGADSRLLCYDNQLETLYVPQLKYAPASKVRIEGGVRCMASDNENLLWVAESGKGVFRINPSTLEVRHYDCPELSNRISNIYCDSRNNVWLTGAKGSSGLYRLDRADDRFRAFHLTMLGKPFSPQPSALTEDKNHRMWLGLWNEGLVSFDPFSGETMMEPGAGSPRSLLHIHSLSMHPDGSLLLGSDHGLTIYDPASRTMTLCRHDELDPGSISGQFIYPLATDAEGGVWIGSFYAGVNYLAPDLHHFEANTHSLYRNSVCGDIVSAFCEDSSGNLYIATDDGGVCRLSAASGQFSPLPLNSRLQSSKEPFSENVHALCMDGTDLWIGTYGEGVTVVNTMSGKIRKYYPGADLQGSGTSSSSSYAIFKDSRGKIWVATTDAIYILNRASDSLELVKNLNVLTIDIDEDRDGNLWFATQGSGLFRFNTNHKVWKNYRFSDARGSLPNNHVQCVVVDTNGSVIVASSKGLCRYCPDSDNFEIIDLGPYTGSMTYSVVDDKGVYWVASAAGLLRHEPGHGTALYTVADGLTSHQFMPNSVLKRSDGEIVFGTVAGYTSFYPYRISTNRHSPLLSFTGLTIINSPVNVGSDRLPESLNSIKCLELSHSDYVFSVTFAALSFANPSKNQYRYRLEGFDKDWVEAGDMNRATYTNLPAGRYVLHVEAANCDGLWCSEGISLAIHVRPPWWATWPMKGLYIALFLLSLYFAMRILLHRSELRHRKDLKRMSDSKEKEVYEAKLSFFSMIAHEIRTPVSLIIGPLEKIRRNADCLPPAISADLDIIGRNSTRLLNLVNQLLDFKKVESGALTANFERHDVGELIMSVAERFRPTVEQKGISLRTVIPDIPLMADVDAEGIVKIVSNLLNNARKFTRDSIVVACSVAPDGESLVISVADNGNGISQSDAERIFNPFVQLNSSAESNPDGTGLGLSIVRRVVSAHGGQVKAVAASGGGAEFIVVLPLSHGLETSPEAAEAQLPEGDAAAWGADSSILLPVIDPEKRKPALLLVDDREDMLSFIADSLGDIYHITTALNGKEALQILSHTKPDLIVSDWMMPDMDGAQLCRHIRADREMCHIPFVMLTARTDDSSKIEGFDCGADAYVEKPFSLAYLEARLRNLFEMRRILRERFSSGPLEPIQSLASNPVDNDFLSRLTALIEENFSNPGLSVEFLASSMGISRTGLYTKLKTLADATPNEIIQITRLKKAAVMLREGNLRINEICYAVGFNSASYFSKCFQKQFGMKPGQFAEQSKGISRIPQQSVAE